MHWKALVGCKVLLLILFTTCAKSDDGEKRVVCYYTNWSVYRPGTAKFSPQNINPYLCTHLIYAFGGFTKDNTLKPFDKYQDIDKGGYAKFTGLKTYNKDLKTLLAIGGWNEGSSRFSPMVADAQRRRKFVKNVVKFLRQNHFDGLDLDWEYPAFRDGGKPRDKDNYANLVQELREEFEKESSKTGKPRLLLTMAVPAGIEYIDKGYDIPRLNEYLDFINLLSYDYHSAYEPAVNHHSPLYPLEEDNEYNYDNELTIDYTIKHLLASGASSNKIVVGIPTYGRSYTLFNEDATALGSPADGPGAEGDATREKGYLAYYEICESIDKEEWTVEKPYPKAMGPYAYSENQWVGYDDEDIVRAKAKYVNENNLGGIMFWSIDNDDFRGKCHGRPYPLIEAAKEALLEDNSSKTKDKEDEKPNSISTKKRNRVSDSSKSNSSSSTGRKSNSSSNRRNSLRTSSDKRSKPKSRTSSTANEKRSNDEPLDVDAEDNENVETTISTTAKPHTLTNKNRFRTRTNADERVSNKKQSARSTTKRPSGNKKVTTPEPPTTPDPGGDFKCEEEGFYPHPRDCKKYFWCLDSGPSGLGIVANQFTCPSGLVFNKLADSCDYPRNVVCPKAKAATVSTTTKRTTTEKEDIIEQDEEDEEEIEELEEDDSQIEKSKELEEKPKKSRFTTTTTTTSTTARPLLYRTISRNRPTTTSTTTTTTTTSAPSTTTSSGRSSDDFTDEEQDPKVIKELIDLIKKAGGIEHLEKQLALQEKNSGTNQENGPVTPATISKSLYERVLNRQAGKNNLFGLPSSRLSISSRKTADVEEDDVEEDEEEEEIEEKAVSRSASRSKFVNGPGRSQFEGLDEVPEVRGLRRSNKPKYVTIERHSSSTTSSKIDDESIEEDGDIDDEENNDNADVASSEEKSIQNVPEEKPSSTQRSTPGYVNIRRTRPTTTESVNDNNQEFDTTAKTQSTHSIRRSSRPKESTIKNAEREEETTTPKTRYVSANRFRSTTNVPPKEFEQTSSETIPTTLSSSSKKLTEDFVTEGKTITIAGESGKISIIPFTTETPSTARLYSEELVPTIKSTTPYFEEKVITTTTPYATRRIYETTLAPSTNIIDDSVTEPLVTVVTTESSTRESIAAVSQPRPFGFPRRTRPTSPTTITEATRSTSRGYEPTSRTKVLDELHHPVSMDSNLHKTTSDFMTESPKKDNNFNNSFYKPENSPKDILFTPLMTPSNQNDIERVVKVPVRFVDGPDNELFFLQIPEKKLSMPGFGSVLKIEVLKNNDYNVSDINILKTEDNDISKHDILPKISTREKTSETVDILKEKSNTDSKIFKINVQRNDNATSDFGSALKVINSINTERKTNQNAFGNFDLKAIQSAILNSQNSLVKDKKPFISDKNLSDKKKVHRQRVLIYRGSTKHQPAESSSQGRWLMKKVVRKRIRRTGSKPGDDLQTSTSVPQAVIVNDPREVNPSRNPGLSVFRRPGDAQLTRGSYASVSTATLPSTKKIYPLHFGVDTRVVGVTADQSGIPQNLELILADPPASISASNSGEPAVIRPNFRRKISTTISPQPAEEVSIGTSSSRIISSDRRRKGHRYNDSDKVASHTSYQIQPRPLKPAVTDYDYYEDVEERFVGGSDGKLIITSRGFIKCLDQGNFPHPDSCKKFISCAKMVNGIVTGTEYTCPDKLSFDPIGGICNWSAGIGCE